MSTRSPRLIVVVGSGGVGKTTLAAGLGLVSARDARDTLVMTFDPSLRLKDALGVDAAALEREVVVETDTPGRLSASLLDARGTFDGLVRRYAPDPRAARRILENRYYAHLAGNLAGILEYMAVERLYDVAREGRHDCVILDTPPTRQALDFLEAPDRIVSFLDSGVLGLARRDWFDEQGRLRPASRLGVLGKGLESWLDRTVGLGLLRDMSEFFRAFGPLFEGFRDRAGQVRELLRAQGTQFVLVAGPGPERVPDAMFFARRLDEGGYRLGPVVVNRLHPNVEDRPGRGGAAASEARTLMTWLGDRDRRGLEELRQRLGGRTLVALPLEQDEPTGLDSLEALGRRLATHVFEKSTK